MKGELAALFISRVVSACISAVVFVWVARLVSIESMGLIGTLSSLGAVVLVFVDLGMSTFVSKCTATGQTSHVQAALKVNAIGSFCFAVLAVLLCIVFLKDPTSSLAACLIVVALSIEKNTDTLTSVALGRRNKRVPAVLTLGRRAMLAVSFFLMLLTGFPVIICYGIALAVSAVLGQFYVRSWCGAWLGAGRVAGRPSCSEVIRLASPYLLANISAQLRQFDVAFVAFFSSSHAAGLYTSAQKLMNPLMLIPSTVTAVVMPHSANYTGTESKRLSLQLTAVSAVLLLLCGIASVFAPELVVTVLGEKYADATGIFVALMFALPFLGLSSSLATILQSQGMATIVGTLSLCLAILTVAAIALAAAFLSAFWVSIVVMFSAVIRSVVFGLLIHFRVR